jgi:hypothetical protein
MEAYSDHIVFKKPCFLLFRDSSNVFLPKKANTILLNENALRSFFIKQDYVISLQGIVYMENSRIVEITAKDTSKYH